MIKKVRQRVNPTYAQTFYFGDQPTPSKNIQKCQTSCTGTCADCRNIIIHPITRQETKQQIQHKHTLGLERQEKNKQSTVAYCSSPQISTLRKQSQLRGQLEEGGVSFFYREKVDNPCRQHGGQLIATDCKFNHTCHGTNGQFNENCVYPNRHFDWLLKQKYDFKHEKPECSFGKTFTFKEKPKKNKK